MGKRGGVEGGSLTVTGFLGSGVSTVRIAKVIYFMGSPQIGP